MGFRPVLAILEVDDGPTFSGAHAVGYSGSDQQAEAISSPGGLWSIGYDEFSYAKVYNDNVAWIQNQSGNWVQPYAANISAALQSAVLAPDTSQNLDGVYTSTNPLAYPISAYSYILFQCAPTSDRPTCVTPYADQGVENTMAQFMLYVACAGQIQMAQIGYAPLPTQLSQFLANAIGYMTGQPPEQLTEANCSNPEFSPSYVLPGSPGDPEASVSSLGPGPGGSGSNGSTASSAGTSSNSATAASKNGKGADAVGRSGSGTQAVGGGSSDWQNAAPVAFVGPALPGSSPLPLLGLLMVIVVPVVLFTIYRRRQNAVPTTPHSQKDGP